MDYSATEIAEFADLSAKNLVEKLLGVSVDGHVSAENDKVPSIVTEEDQVLLVERNWKKLLHTTRSYSVFFRVGYDLQGQIPRLAYSVSINSCIVALCPINIK